MAKSAVTPARRRRRILRDALLLAVVLVVLLLRTEFPIFTAGQALAATQARYFFGPGEVAAVLDHTTSRLISRLAVRSPVGDYDRYYILRQGDWYAWCGIDRFGPFWRSGGLGAVENDPDTPLVPLVIYGDGYDYCGLVLALCNDPSLPLVPLPRRDSLLVVVNDPDIAEVEVLYYAQYSGGFHTLRQTEPLADKCYLFYRPAGQSNYHFDDDGFLLRGYDRAGNLIYESEAPSHWAEWWGLTIPE